jgi:TonB family protein
LNEIKNKSGINFIYKDDLVDKVNVTFRVDGNSAENMLEKLLNKYGIAYKVFEGNSYVLYKPEEAKEIKNIYKAILIEQPVTNMDPAVFLSKPKLISKMDPLYPPEAVKNNIEGNVNLKLFITKEGNVAKTLIVNSSGSSILDSAAVRHTDKLKFLPAKENGEPKNVWISMIFKYQITGKMMIILRGNIN